MVSKAACKESLKNLVLDTLEMEDTDFLDAMHSIDYEDILTPAEHSVLYEWARDSKGVVEAPVELLEKCPHRYAKAALLQVAIAQGIM